MAQRGRVCIRERSCPAQSSRFLGQLFEFAVLHVVGNLRCRWIGELHMLLRRRAVGEDIERRAPSRDLAAVDPGARALEGGFEGCGGGARSGVDVGDFGERAARLGCVDWRRRGFSEYGGHCGGLCGIAMVEGRRRHGGGW